MPRVADRAAPRFTEVKAGHSSPGFRAYLQRGLAELQKSDTPEARRTLKLLASGKVKVDEFLDVTPHDFLHMRRDLPAERLKVLDARAVLRISRAINGYQWDDRIYVHRGLTPRKLASTLVHEVTHVLTRAEENYRGPKAILRQEYAAFYAERRFLGVEMTAPKRRALKEWIIEVYELKNVTPEDVPDQPVLPPPPRKPAASRGAAATR